MTDIDVREALERATRHLDPPVDLVTRARQRGRRRLARRRAVLGAGLAVLLVASLSGVVGLRHWQQNRPVLGAELFDAPTRGDLATDAEYLRQVVDMWNRQQAAPEVLVGDPHVVWAGSTPAGPAAFVAQRQDGGEPGLSAVVGYVEDSPDGPRYAGGEGFLSRDGVYHPPAVLLGDARDVLLVLDPGFPVTISTRRGYHPDGRVDRSSAPVRFTDGAAVLKVPAQRDRLTVALSGAFPRGTRHIEIANADGIKAGPDGQEPAPSVLHRVLPGAAATGPGDPPHLSVELIRWRDTALAPYLDDPALHRAGTQPTWWINGSTPDGRRLWVQAEATWNEPARVLAVLGRPGEVPRVIYGGTVARGGALGVRLRLPDGQGVVVAAQQATLRYRTATGGWQAVTGDAALLPAAATHVQVTRGSAAAVTVPLP